MDKIFCLIDYKGKFETKVPSEPYGSGFDKKLLKKYFEQFGFKIIYLRFSDIDFKNDYRNQIFIYTSSEDFGLYYKSYIEDIIFGLDQANAVLLPDSKFLRAHHNKVYMEILRDLFLNNSGIKSNYFGTLNELLASEEKITYPLIVKPFAGSSSKGVGLVFNREELISHVKKISRCFDFYGIYKDVGLKLKKKLLGDYYRRDSIFKKKFVTQNYVENLSNDWKILIYGNKYYTLFRENRAKDFRASGSGIFKTSDMVEIPEGMLNYARSIYGKLKVPQISLDLAYDGEEFYLIEFQALSFGTLTQTISNSYFENTDNAWKRIERKLDIEFVYAECISNFIKYNIYD
jgi:hypothetical protein